MTAQLESRFALGGAVEVAKYRLANGMVAIVCPDHSAPLVSMQIWYRVGSADEPPGAAGVAHFFEHLMWSPTRSRAAGEFDRLIENAGGDCNAATWLDWTSYRDTVPSADFALACELEAERMTELAIDPAGLEAEREVIINERRERVEDDIEGFLDEALMDLAFAVHPYGRPTIGTLDDIRAIDLAGVERFYRTYYAPNNAVAVVAGDVDPAGAVAEIERRFGSIEPSEDLPARSRQPEPAQLGPRRRGVDRPTTTARLLLGYTVCGQSHPDWPALSALSGLLASGPSSRLYRELVIEREIATYAEADVLPLADASMLEIAVGGTAETTAAELEEATLAVLDDLCRTPIAAAELDKVKAGAETDFWSELETVDGRGEALGHFEAALGDHRMVATVAERLAACDAAALETAARRYLGADRRCAVWADPR